MPDLIAPAGGLWLQPRWRTAGTAAAAGVRSGSRPQASPEAEPSPCPAGTAAGGSRSTPALQALGGSPGGAGLQYDGSYRLDALTVGRGSRLRQSDGGNALVAGTLTHSSGGALRVHAENLTVEATGTITAAALGFAGGGGGANGTGPGPGRGSSSATVGAGGGGGGQAVDGSTGGRGAAGAIGRLSRRRRGCGGGRGFSWPESGGGPSPSLRRVFAMFNLCKH